MRFFAALKQNKFFVKIICSCLLINVFILSAKAGDSVTSESDEVLQKYNEYYSSLKEFRANHDYQNGIAASADYLKQIEKAENGKKKRYALILAATSYLYDESGNHVKAIELAKESSEILKKETSDYPDSYIEALCRLANFYMHDNQAENAIFNVEEARTILKNLGKENSRDYATLTGNLAVYYNKIDEIKKSIDLNREALKIIELIDGRDSRNYAVRLGLLANGLFRDGQTEKAINDLKEAITIVELEGDYENEAYMTLVNNLSAMQNSCGEYVDALINIGKAKDVCELLYGVDSPKYATYISNYGVAQAKLGKYQDAIQSLAQALSIQKKIYGSNHADVAITLVSLGSLYNCIGEYPEALRLQEEAKNIFAKTIGEESIYYAKALMNMASEYYYLGNYYESNKLMQEAIEIASKKIGREKPEFVTLLIGQSVNTAKSGFYAEAISIDNEILDVLKNTVGVNNETYAIALSNKSQHLYLNDQIQEAIELAKHNVILNEELFGKMHPEYSRAIFILAGFLRNSGDFKNGLDLEQDAITLFENVYGRNHPLFIEGFADLCCMLSLNGNSSSAAANAIKCSDLMTKLVMRTFMELTSHERSLAWKKYSKWYTNIVPRIAFFNNSKRMMQTAYDATLFSKSLLLNTEIELLNLISEEGNDEDIELYYTIADARRQLSKIYEFPIEQQKLKTDSLEKFINNSELELLGRSKAYGDYTKRLCVKWEDVKNALGPKDIAIEFASFHNISEFHKNDSLQYIAFVLKKDYEAPKVLPICKIPYEKTLFGSDISRTINEGDIIWGPLADMLDDVENIYFSPTGELYNVPIEYMNYFKDGSKSMSDVFNIKRLSSTREIALQNNNGAAMSTASLFGGLIYGNSTDMADKAEKRGCEDDDVLILRDHFGPLVETKFEVENISKYLKQMDVKYKLFTDSIGTESSFRALSKSNLNLLHIATHGFYWTQKDVRRFNFTGFLNPNRFANFSEEDRALARSGILFAGAETSFQYVSDNFDPDDGIVTAKEIAQLDFRNMDLAVLSACQTGLGDISPDGVYGLQRGFKKAGVQSLLMSLWKVDDKATQLLMTNFYKGLAEGKSKVEALRLAQDYLRNLEVEEVISAADNLTAAQRRKAERQDTSQEDSVVKSRPYSSPKYWSAFVLLDALD